MPPICLNAEASQNMNEPAAKPQVLLTAFQSETKKCTARRPVSTRTVQPPAMHRPPAIAAAVSANSSRLGCESASTNTSQSPLARAAPALRARAIWLTGSNTTVAPSARANSAVRSVELLSHTIVSVAQPRASNASAAARTLASVAGSSFSSLNAGMTTEIFTALRRDPHRSSGRDPVEQLDDVVVAHPDATYRPGRAHRDRIGTAVDVDVPAHRVDLAKAVLPRLATGQPQNPRENPVAPGKALAQIGSPDLAGRTPPAKHGIERLPRADLRAHDVLAARSAEAPLLFACAVPRRRHGIALELPAVV